MSTNFRWMRLIAPLALLIAVMGVWAQAPEEATKPEAAEPERAEITVLERGAAPRRELRYTPEVGRRETMVMTMRMTMERSMDDFDMPAMSMPAFRFTIDTEVLEIAENGDISARLTYRKAEALDEPGVDQMMLGMMRMMTEQMRGLAGVLRMTDRGETREMRFDNLHNLDPMMAQQIEGFTQMTEQIAAILPAEPIGTGARWRADSIVTMNNVTMKMEATYTVDSMEGNEVRLRLDVAQSADPQDVEVPEMAGAEMRLESLEGKGSGETRFRLDRITPLRTTMNMDSRTKMRIEQFGESQSMTQKMEMKMTIEPGSPAEEAETDH